MPLNISQTALSGYTIMWLYVMFDLPTNTKKQRDAATHFRKALLKDGFGMMQYSVYTRHCASGESAAVHINRVKNIVPAEGIVSILKVTDKQFGETIQFIGRKAKPPPATPQQLEFF